MFIPRASGIPSNQLDWAQMFRDRAELAVNPLLKAFYQQGAASPQTPLAEVEFVAMDFETTGLDADEHSILSIGLVPFTLQRVYCRKARHWVLSPRKPLVEDSVQYHGITHSDIDNQPDLSEILPELLQSLAGKVVVVHHRGIERPFLDASLRSRLSEGIEFPVIDTMELEARLHRRGGRGWQRLIGRTPASIRLADSRHRYNLPFYQLHHALTDAVATAELFQAQVQTHYSEQTLVSELWW